DDAGVNVGERAGCQRTASIARGSDHGRFAELVIAGRAVPIDAGAPANHGPVIAEGGPREADGGLELPGVVHSGAESVRARSKKGRQILRLGEVGIVEALLRVPGEAIVEREARRDLPRVLEIGAVLVVVPLRIIAIRRRRGNRAHPNSAEDAAVDVQYG